MKPPPPAATPPARGCSPRIGVALVGALAAFVSAAQPARLVVVQAGDTPRLARTLAALQARTSLPVDVIRVSGERDQALEQALSKGARDSVVVALGPRASDLVLNVAVPGPVVHCLAAPDALRAGLPAVPSAKRVGVLFDPVVNTRRAEAVAAALDLAGYKVVLQAVSEPSALPTALAGLTGRADVLLALPDRTVYAPEAANGILLFSFRNNIPLVGPNDAWVKRGALFAIDWDYAEVGAACAALALRESASRAAPLAAPRPRVYVNPKVASRFGLGWDAQLLATPGVQHE